jgi:hypothetical protein
MSRRINCTLTDRQWHLLVDAVGQYEVALEDEIASGDAPPQSAAALERMWDRVMGAPV